MTRALFLLPPETQSGRGGARSRRFLRRLPASGTIRVGSAADCEVQLAGADVSPVHGHLTCSPDALRMEATPDATAFLLDGNEIREASLWDGATVEIGGHRLQIGRGDGDALEGALLGGYLIQEHLGDGSMGAVYRALQLSLDRTVALKILLAELTQDREFVKGFLREARAVARLDHTNVVQIFDALQNGDTFFFVLEFVEGGSLSDALSERGVFPFDRTLAIALDVGRALAWAESRGIVHRDIKPDNILLTPEGVAKISDLGIALVHKGTAGSPQAVMRGVGSPRYMSPEQAIGGEVDHRTDVYSLGCTIYRMLAGRAPFEGETVREILQAKRQGQAPPLDFLSPRTPRPVAQVVDRMLAREMDDRYPSCEAALAALEAAASNAKKGSRLTRRRRRKILRRYGRAARRSAKQPLLLVLLVAVILVLLWLVRRVFLPV